MPWVLLLVAGGSGAWLFAQVLEFMETFGGAVAYKAATGRWGWAEGMVVGRSAALVFVPVLLQTLVLVIAARHSKRVPEAYPRWYFGFLGALCGLLGVGYYILLFAFGLLPG